MSSKLPMELLCPICDAQVKFTGVIFSEEKHLDSIHFESYKVSYPGYRATDYQIFKCKSCEHQFCWPMPSKEYLDIIYGKHFYDNYFGGIGYEKAFEKYLKRDFELKLAFIHQLCSENEWIPSDISVLEIGSGPGNFAKMLQQSGIACTPVDTNQDAVILGQNIGVQVLDIDLGVKNNPLDGNKYDIVISWATIEHVPDVMGFVHLANHYIKKGGLFVCDTGNANDPYLIWDSGFTNWIYPPLHVHYFSVQSLRKCFRKVGFKMIKIYPRSEILFGKRIPEKIEGFISFMRYSIGRWRRILINIFNPSILKEKPGEYASIMLGIAKKVD